MYNKYEEIENKYRPVAFWSLNDLLCRDELLHQIKEFKNQGFGGFFMHPRVGLLTKINSPEWFEMLGFCIETAKSLGLDAWLYDEDRWPSGYAGGEVAKTEEFRQRALVLLKEDELLKDDTVLDECDFKGEHYFIAKRVTPTGDEWFNGMCYTDLMNPEAVEKFLSCTLDEYKKALGKHFGTTVPGIFTDEPSYKMHNSYKAPSLPWSEYLDDFFKNRHGFDIKNHLKELFFPTGDYNHIRFCFFDSASNLLLESFTKQYYKRCDESNLKFVGHFMAEDNMHYQTQWVGNVMPHYEFMHYPGIDKLGRHIDRNITVKQVASVSRQLGKKRTLSEVFGCIGQQCGFREMKWIADWQAILGIDLITPHLSLYSMKGARKRDFPANISFQQPWWDESKGFFDYLSRLSEIIAKGKRETDILVLHPVASAWSVYNPLDMVPGHTTEYDPPFEALTAALISENLDFHFGDEMIMAKHGSVKDGKLVIGECGYSTVVVPPSLTLRASTVKLLEEFCKKCGGRLIMVSPLPCRIDGKAAQLPFNQYIKRNSIGDTVSYLKELYPDRTLTTDRMTGENAAKLITCTVNNGDDRIVLFANTEKKREVNARLSVCDSRTPRLLDLATGRIHTVNSTRDRDRVTVDVTLYAAGSMALLFSAAAEADRPVIATETGAEFKSVFDSSCDCRIYSVTAEDENVLPINDVSLWLKGKAIENVPIELIRNNHFYTLTDGEAFKLEYKFNVDEIPQGELYAAIECAENYDSIHLNGIALEPSRKKGDTQVFDKSLSYLDASFTRVLLKGLRTGGNTLAIEGKKVNNLNGRGGHYVIDAFSDYRTTELESVYIVGDFDVIGSDREHFSITKAAKLSSCTNLTRDAHPFYAGKCRIKARVQRPEAEHIYLKTEGSVFCDCVLYVNGKRAGEKYMMPYVTDITGYLTEGENELELCICNTLFNLMGPNRRDDILNISYVCPETFDDMTHFTKKYTLLPFGIEKIKLIW